MSEMYFQNTSSIAEVLGVVIPPCAPDVWSTAPGVCFSDGMGRVMINYGDTWILVTIIFCH